MAGSPDHGVMSPSPRLWRMRCAEVAGAGGAGAVVAGTAAGLTLGLAAAAIAAAVVIAAALTALWLPVGTKDEARRLLAVVLPAAGGWPELSPPPRRARWKAPLSYHFLAAGHDGMLAMAVTGRVRRETTLVPLAKTQSVRLVQGPLQRWLGLATVHLDAAGKRVRAEFRERQQEQARALVGELAALSRSARRQTGQPPRPTALADGLAAPPHGTAGPGRQAEIV